MKNTVLAALAAASFAIGIAGQTQAQPRSDARFSEFDVRNARSWAEKLVLCDVTAFLATRPDLNANRMWVRRDDGHNDLLLPPDFVGAGRWYKEGYEQLYWNLKRRNQVSSDELRQTQASLGRRFVEAYRTSGYNGPGEAMGFLDKQDGYCRSMARHEGVIVS